MNTNTKQAFIAALIFIIPMISFSQEYDIDTLTHFSIAVARSPQFFVINDSGSLVVCMDGWHSSESGDIVLYDPAFGQERLALGPTLSPELDSTLNVTTGYSDIIKHIDGRIFASTCGDTVIVSSDGGNHWVMDDSGFIDGTLILDLASSPRGYILAATSTGLYKRTDTDGWKLQQAAGPNFGWNRVFTASNGNMLVISAGYFGWRALLLSKDDGMTWSEVPSVNPMYLGVDMLFTSPNVIKEDNRGRLYIPSDTLLISDDFGETWVQKLDYYPRRQDWNSMAFTSENKIIVFNPYLTEITETPDTIIVHNITVFDGSVGGYRPMRVPYVHFAAVHPNNKIYALHIHYIQDDVYPYFHAIGGILYTPKNYVVSSTEPLPEILSLSSSYPNPVSSGAPVTLTYTLMRAAAVTLRVQDVLGRTVHEEALGSLAPGEHTRTLPTASLRPGMYFYTLLPGEGKRMVGKVVVAK